VIIIIIIIIIMSTTMASIVGAAFAQSSTSNVTTAAAAASASASSSQQAGAAVTSSGLVNGDNPLHHALLLLIIQIGVIIFLSRFVTFLLRPLKQPRVVAEIVAGILLGPTAFGLIPAFTQNIFPQSSLGILETLANVGLIFFLFLVGLELDIHKLRK
jgi:predicted Kef-type K+ transport protein